MPNYHAQPVVAQRYQPYQDQYRQSFNKENSYAQMQKRKMQSGYASQQVLQKTEMRPSSTQQRQVPPTPIQRPSSADKRAYSTSKQQRSSFKELKNSSYIAQQYQPPTYQQKYYSIKQEVPQPKMIKSHSNQQLKVEQQEYQKLHDKLQFLETKINKIKSNIDINNTQLQKQSQRDKPIGLAAKFFQKKEQVTSVAGTGVERNQPLEKKSTNLDQYVTQVKKEAPIPGQITNTITNLINKVTRHQSLDNSARNQEKSAQSSKALKEDQFFYYITSIVKAYESRSQNRFDDLVKEHLLQTIQGLEYAKNTRLPGLDNKVQMLPRSNFQKTIIFDLDETLIHCNESAQVPGDVILPITFPTGDTIQASVNVRPFAVQILQQLSKHFEIIVFTASHQCYASVVLDHLDPKQQYISHRFYRESCLQSEEGAYIKDLRVIGNRKLSNILLVDNASYSFGQQIDNGIPIIAFYDNKSDQELLYLQNYLMKFRTVADVRELNRQQLRLNEFTNYSDPLTLISSLFPNAISDRNF